VPVSDSTPCGADKAQALAGGHQGSFGQRIAHLEAQCNALVSHLHGARTLLDNDPFLMLPAVAVVRAVAEVSASCAWEVDAEATSDERSARSYATAFRSLETVLSQFAGNSAEAQPLVELREKLVTQLKDQGYRVVRREKRGISTLEVSQIIVRKASAKVGFQFTQRIRDEIPTAGDLYASMSGMTHGEPSYLSITWDTPEVVARMLGIVAFRSTEAWSNAVHRWVGAEPPPFINGADYANLMRSASAEHRAGWNL